MLAGLEPDAIIFTGGDNDTYPLWYIQNVERYRTDVRVIVLHPPQHALVRQAAAGTGSRRSR